jgi:uncharacterized protein YqhQ
VLYETLIVGTRWLVRSASVQAEEDDVEIGKGAVALMLGFTLLIGIGVFFLLPLLLSSVIAGGSTSRFAQPAVEGLIQVAIFIGYLALISRMPDIHRVFQYHGAEHMTIHALEAGDPLVVDEIRKYPTAHPRCGTEFLVVLIALSIFTFSLVGKQEPLVMVGSRFVLIPVLASVGYEVLRLGARFRSNPLIRVIMWPGILVQKITTKQPTPDMIEVAIVSMEEALRADGEPVPSQSGLEREPLAAPGSSEHAAAGRRVAGEAEAAAPVSIDPPLPGA